MEDNCSVGRHRWYAGQSPWKWTQLLLLLTASHAAKSITPPSTGLYFMLNGTVYLPGSSVAITDVGRIVSFEPENAGSALVCATDNINTQCCRGQDGGAVGDWYFPNGTIVSRRIRLNENRDFARTGSTLQVRLNRLTDVVMPVGEYECRIPNPEGNITVTAGILILVLPTGSPSTPLITEPPPPLPTIPATTAIPSTTPPPTVAPTYGTTTSANSPPLPATTALEIRSIMSMSPDNSTLLLNWLPPASPNGVVLNYTVTITLYSNGQRISQESTTATMYTATHLIPGVPYRVSIHLAGQSEVELMAIFTQELGLQWNF